MCRHRGGGLLGPGGRHARRRRSDDADLRGHAAEGRELIGERTRAALAAAKARGAVLGGGRGHRPAAGPDSGAAALARRLAAARAAHRLALEAERLRA